MPSPSTSYPQDSTEDQKQMDQMTYRAAFITLTAPVAKLSNDDRLDELLLDAHSNGWDPEQLAGRVADGILRKGEEFTDRVRYGIGILRNLATTKAPERPRRQVELVTAPLECGHPHCDGFGWHNLPTPAGSIEASRCPTHPMTIRTGAAR
jgi:hypothetical protein